MLLNHAIKLQGQYKGGSASFIFIESLFTSTYQSQRMSSSHVKI